MDPSAVLVLSASNRVRAANLGEAALNNELVAFNLLPNTGPHPPFSRGGVTKKARDLLPGHERSRLDSPLRSHAHLLLGARDPGSSPFRNNDPKNGAGSG